MIFGDDIDHDVDPRICSRRFTTVVRAIGVGDREAGLIAPPPPRLWIGDGGSESVLPSQLLVPNFNVTKTQKEIKFVGKIERR